MIPYRGTGHVFVIGVMGYDFLLVPLPLDAQGGIEGGLESRVCREVYDPPASRFASRVPLCFAKRGGLHALVQRQHPPHKIMH